MSLTALSSGPAKLLVQNKHRVATVESTTAGLIGASLLATPGASRFFISSCVVYSGRGYKQHLSQEILDKSGVLQREHNYANRENYVESKRLFVKEVSLYMKEKLRADWMVVESGTVGPEFYIPGVKTAFTGIVGPDNPDGSVNQWVEIIETKSSSREDNMWDFTKASLDLLEKCILEYGLKIQNDTSKL